MDIELNQLFSKMTVDNEDDVMDEVTSNVYEIKDNTGITIEVVKLRDNVVTPRLVKGFGDKMVLKLQDLRELQMQEDDILLCSYPKTGNHWLSNMLYCLLHTQSLENVPSFQPCFVDLYPPKLLQFLTKPRIMISHRRPSQLPADIFKKRGKVILLYRNPKDTAVSHYHHIKTMHTKGSISLTWSCFLEHWMGGLVPPDDYFDYHKAWESAIRENENKQVLLVCFEDLKRDGLRELRRIQTHLGLSHNDDRLQQILDKCSIGNLRNDVHTGKVKTPFIDKEGNSIIYRKGIHGDWRSHFTIDQNEAIENMVRDKMRKDSIFKFNYQPTTTSSTDTSLTTQLTATNLDDQCCGP